MAWVVSGTYSSGKPNIWSNADHAYRVVTYMGRFAIRVPSGIFRQVPLGMFLRGKRNTLRLFKTPEAAQVAADKEAARKVATDE